MANSKSVREQIGKNIKEIREKKKLTQEEVAKEAGILGNYYAKIERGEISTTSAQDVFSKLNR